MLGIASRQRIDPDSMKSMLPEAGSGDGADSTLFIDAWCSVNGINIFENNDVSVVSETDIYNLDELRAFVEHETIQSSELIGLLYLKYGLLAFERLRGLFSICILDKRQQKIVIGTDRFGVKPVYYYADGKNFVFGSTVKEILSIPQVKFQEINYEAVVDYINLSSIPTPKTIFRDIKKLPPGNIITVERESLTLHFNQYYDIEYSENRSPEKYFLDKLPPSIEESVKIVLDYELSRGSRIGAFLSGGTDSSTVAGMLKKLNGAVRTFSIGFDEKGYNELDYARITARHFGAEHFEYMVTPEDVVKAIDVLLDVYDEPFGNASAIPTYFCALLAKKNNVNTLFAGDGGDEIFGGNQRYASENVFAYYHTIPKFLRKRLIEPALTIIPPIFTPVEKGKKYIKRANCPQPDRFFSYNPILSLGRDNIFSPDFLKRLNGYDPVSWARELYSRVKAGSELNKLLYMDMKFSITDNDVRKVSDMSGRAGIRICYPFLDHRLVDFAATLPARLKVKGTSLRYIFKKALRDFLPIAIIEKKKHGFGLPIGMWIKTKKNINPLVRETLHNPDCAIRPFFRKGFLEDIFQLHEQTGAAYYGDIIWLLLILELWWKRYQT